MQPTPSGSPARRARLAILALFLILASAYSVIVPAWEAPDEVGHFGYVLHWLREHTLPVQRVGELGEAHQPPLYYWVAAAAAGLADVRDAAGSFRPNPRFIWAGQGGAETNAALHSTSETFPFQGQALALHLARAASVLMGCVTVALTCALGWEVWPSTPEIGLLAAALVAFNPQFLFIHAAVNNDNLLTLAASGAWLALLRAQKRSEEWLRWAYVGLWLSAAMMAKLGGVVIVGVAAATLLASTARPGRLTPLLQGALATFLPVLLATGWWFWRNQVLYGDALGWTVFARVFSAVLRRQPLQWSDIALFLRTQVDFFWGVFG